MLGFLTPETAEIIPYEFDARRMCKTETAELIRLLIPEGKAMHSHDNPFDVIFYVIKGYGELTVEGEVFKMSSESCLPVKTGKNRAWRNIGPDDLIILVVKLL
jgi:quercetin dioxygenase-like cupin family protein